MDIQRTLLIGATVLLSFMLLTEWVAFKDERRSVLEQGAERLTASGDTQTSDTPAVAEPVSSGSVAGIDASTPQSATSDLPQDLPPAPDNSGESAEERDAGTTNDNIIQVFTGTLQLAIDLNGGDIVEVALPKHLEDIDDPDTPFVLLERNSRRTYVAQSGLIGKDGIDSQQPALPVIRHAMK